MKKIMIIGGGELQLPVIRAAKKLGYRVIVADQNAQSPGMRLADIKAVISTVDGDKILEFAKENKIDGIVTAATDFPVRSVAKVAEKMSLIGIDEDTAFKTTDKLLMRKCLREYGVSVPAFYGIKSFQELLSVLDTISYDKSYIIKPVDNSGSRGVFYVEDIRDRGKLREIFEYSKGYSRSGTVILEEYMEGDEISVETFCVNGVCEVLQMTDKVTGKAPYFVEKMHIQPSRYGGSTKEKVVVEVKRALKALGVNNGPAHTEVMITKEGPKIVELGARTAGDHISSELLYLSAGIDLPQNLVLFAMGEKTDLTPRCSRVSVIKYIEADEGIIRSVRGVEEAKKIEGVHSVELLKKVGDYVGPVQNSADRIGYIIISADSRAEALEMAEAAAKLIKVEVTE